MALMWFAEGSLLGPPGADGSPGTDGSPGAAGVGIVSADVNASGDLILSLSDGGEINAGGVRGTDGAGVNFENSVPTVAELPASPAMYSAYYVVENGHLYVYEGADAAQDAPGYTDVGRIRGEDGPTGPRGSDGVSVTSASVDAGGALLIVLSSGTTINAGPVRGPAGSDGAPGTNGTNGAPGPRGTGIESYTGTIPDPATGGRIVGDLAINATTGELFRVIDA